MPCILKTVHKSGYYAAEKAFCARSAKPTHHLARRSTNENEATIPTAMAVLIGIVVFVAVVTLIAAFFIFKKKRGHGKPATKNTANKSNDLKLRTLRSLPESPIGRTLRDRRGLSELSLHTERPGMPTLPAATHRSKPDIVFPGVRYGMGQIGRDGRVHRPESIPRFVSMADVRGKVTHDPSEV